MKNILVLNGNPKPNSFAHQISDTYQIEAREHLAVRRINLAEMTFNPDLSHGYDEPLPLEESLQAFQQAVLWADHIVVIAPVWWGGIPAKLKGMFDRAFLPGFAFSYEGDNPEPKQLLAGKTSRIFLTMDAPMEFADEQALPVLEQLNRFTLEFCGIKNIGISLFGSVIMSDDKQRDHWLTETKLAATQDC